MSSQLEQLIFNTCLISRKPHNRICIFLVLILALIKGPFFEITIEYGGYKSDSFSEASIYSWSHSALHWCTWWTAVWWQKAGTPLHPAGYTCLLPSHSVQVVHLWMLMNVFVDKEGGNAERKNILLCFMCMRRWKAYKTRVCECGHWICMCGFVW